MSLNIGIVGLPNAGKSTLFNALTACNVPAENFPFCTIDPATGVVAVPDLRLEKIAAIYQPQKVTPTTVEFVDIAGLVKNASQGEGLGNQFLSHIREVDAILHVVRCFEDPNVVHVSGKVDPREDIEIINMELALTDLETVSKTLAREEKQLKAGSKETAKKTELLKKLKAALEKGEPVRQLPLNDEEQTLLQELHLLTAKPMLYLANVAEGQKEVAGIPEPIPLCGKLEAELAQLKGEEKQEFLKAMGLKEPGLNRLIRAGYKLLNLITFFTAGPKECRAWTITKGTKAPQAAGKIHSDFERGFIRAEVMAYDDLVASGSEAGVKSAGKYRSEGKGYVLKDGDIVLFRFNVTSS